MLFRDFCRLSAHIQMMPILEAAEETLIGGQAVIEGVMMRSPHAYCIAVRKPDGQIVTTRERLEKISVKYPIFKMPVIRGVGTLGQAMGLGIKALRFSTDAALEGASAPNEPKKEISSFALGLNLLISFAFFIFLYKFVPLYLTASLEKIFPALHGRVLFNLTDGLIRMAIFVSFLFLISRWKDIRRVFEYHGAEHRVVFAYESGKPLTVAEAQRFPTLHPRCGTSFLMVVMLVSIAVYTLLPFDSFVAKFLSRIALLPLIAGLSYETIRFAAKHRGGLLSTLTAPGLWLQKITTQPPSDDQTEVAIEALEGAMELEKSLGGELVIA